MFRPSSLIALVGVCCAVIGCSAPAVGQSVGRVLGVSGETLSSAEASAVAHQTGRRVEVSSLTTPTSITWANPNGTMELVQNALPVRARVNGRWQALGSGQASPTSDGKSHDDRAAAASLAGGVGRTSGGKAVNWATTDAAFPSQPYWRPTGADSMHVGFIGAGNSPDGQSHKARSYWQMDVSAVHDTHIISAQFVANEVWSFSCSKRSVQLWTSAAASSATTWNNQPPLSALSDTVSAASGYNSSCPGSAVGFDATAATQRAADAGATVENLALVAADETDQYGWKKFAPNAQMSINFASYPVTPAYRGVTPCFPPACGSGAAVRSHNPLFQAWSNIADSGVSLNYNFQVCAGTAASTGGCVPVFTKSHVAPGGAPITAQLPSSSSLPDGKWVYRVEACRDDSLGLCSAYTDWLPFIVKTSGPAVAPVVTSTQLDLSGKTHKGRKGAAATISISANGASDDVVFAYSLAGGGFTLTSGTCAATYGDVHVVCAGASASAIIVPQGMSGTLTVVGFDRAGNASPVSTSTFFLESDLAASVAHAWFGHESDYSSSPQATSLADQSTAAPLSLHLSGVGWVANGQESTTPPSGPADDYGIPSAHPVGMTFDGTTSIAVSDASNASPPVAFDASHSATVAVWVSPRPGSSGTRTAFAQNGPDGRSAFALLETADGHWEMCLSNGAGGQDCAISHVTSDDDGTWALLVGQWDAVNKQISVQSYRYDPSGYWLNAGDTKPNFDISDPVAHTAVSASVAPVTLGASEAAGGYVNRWDGELADPMLFGSLLDAKALWFSPAAFQTS